MVLRSVKVRLAFGKRSKFGVVDRRRAIQNFGVSSDSLTVWHSLSLALSWTYKSEGASRLLLLLLLRLDFRDFGHLLIVEPFCAFEERFSLVIGPISSVLDSLRW